jgi:transposase
VQPYRLATRHQASVRFETPPGQQGQVDWGLCRARHMTLEFYVTTPGKNTLVRAVRLQLGTSHRTCLC